MLTTNEHSSYAGNFRFQLTANEYSSGPSTQCGFVSDCRQTTHRSWYRRSTVDCVGSNHGAGYPQWCKVHTDKGKPRGKRKGPTRAPTMPSPTTTATKVPVAAPITATTVLAPITQTIRMPRRRQLPRKQQPRWHRKVPTCTNSPDRGAQKVAHSNNSKILSLAGWAHG